MIDQLVQTRLAALHSEAEQRALVQRLMTVLGNTDPPEVKRVEWEGQKATMYTWGEVVLVGRMVFRKIDIEGSGGKYSRRVAKALPAGEPDHPIMKHVTPDNQAEVEAALEDALRAFGFAA